MERSKRFAGRHKDVFTPDDMQEQRLRILRECEYRTKSGKTLPRYLCECSCGNKKIVSKASYDRGKTRSCGCLIRDFNKQRAKYYNNGSYFTGKELGVDESVIKRISNSYKAMMGRCYGKNNWNYKNYGGRGICVCDEWKTDKYAFIKWSVENGYEIGKSIDRIDVNGNYCPENCRWLTAQEQARNTRRNVFIKFNGETYTITDLSRMLGVDAKILSPLAKHGIELRKEEQGKL